MNEELNQNIRRSIYIMELRDSKNYHDFLIVNDIIYRMSIKKGFTAYEIVDFLLIFPQFFDCVTHDSTKGYVVDSERLEQLREYILNKLYDVANINDESLKSETRKILLEIHTIYN